MNKQHITKDVFLERLNEKYSEKITYLKAKYEGIVRLCERYDTDLSLETKNAILKHAKRKTLDKVSASAL